MRARPGAGGLDLAGMVVALDALVAQRDAARLITRAGGHYLMIVKSTSRSCSKPSPPHRPVTEPGRAFSVRFSRLVPAVTSARARSPVARQKEQAT